MAGIAAATMRIAGSTEITGTTVFHDETGGGGPLLSAQHGAGSAEFISAPL
jgi:hypothetical protein